ncbi:hypothetical protein LEP1GSC008_1914 [Leptospira kirschneri serovar Bulgarica str. Nikolaevo]|uniref:Uncharacterized protein n=1 Tax=Leptospira kirschneri serovar Bulgarica str. Nikolaevo TaxID=1240687 RepID=M6FCG3_9LEPT|nr:hypothetical protein LEP1GSC008_1914 [Leptospira kirschneri serovar Bulgarica str. Nikolaevo]
MFCFKVTESEKERIRMIQKGSLKFSRISRGACLCETVWKKCNEL